MADRPSPDTRASVAVIVHGLVWPDARAREALRVRLVEAIPNATIVEARGADSDAARAGAHAGAEAGPSAGAATRAGAEVAAGPGTGAGTGAPAEVRAGAGASAVMARAAASTTADILLFLEPSQLPDASDIQALLAAATRGLAIAGTHSAAPPPSPGPDLLSTLSQDSGTPISEPTTATHGHTPVWAIARRALDAIGGIDADLWSVGVTEDLAARAALAGVPVSHVNVRWTTTGPPAWPLPPAVARLLAIRNPLLTAFKTQPPDALGVSLARHAARAILEAWHATGLTADTFAFGGTFGRGGGAWQKLSRTVTGRAGLDLPLRDPDACLLPLLALDSAMEGFVTRVEERRAWQRSLRTRLTPPSPPHPNFDEGERGDGGVRGRFFAASDASDRSALTSPPYTQAAPSGAASPTVSVIVVTWNGREHLQDCFGSLLRSDYPADRLQLVCVDNGSTDGSVDFVRQTFPQVTIVALDRNTGFTQGNEAGVAAARGDVLVFLNNDMRVEPDCLRELVGALDDRCACAGARVLSWNGRAIDFVRGSLNFEARGFQDFYGMPNVPELATPAETFFPNGGAFAVTREAYARAGGFDPSFFAYYDDVDLGWRLRLTGTDIRVAGRAVVYHRHGATSRVQPRGQKRFLMDRNALWTLMKNYGEPALVRTFGAVLLLAVRRMLDEGRLDRGAPLARQLAPFVERCRRNGRGDATGVGDAHGVSKSGASDGGASDSRASDGRVSDGRTAAAAGGRAALRGLPLEALGALGAALDALPRIAAARARVQRARVVSDRDVLPRFGRALEPVWALSSYKRIQQTLMEAHALTDVFRARTRLLIIGHEALARHMSGPAVRVLEIGRALSTVARVTVATPAAKDGAPAEIDDPRCTFAVFDPAEPSGLRRLAEDADVLLVQGFTLVQYPFLKTLHIPIVVDLYCPFTLEHLEQTRARLATGADTDGERLAAAHREATGVLGVQNEQLLDGDFFLCASETQRDFWIGTLHTQGRINPLTYGDDPTLRRLIDVVPFGLPEVSVDDAAARADATRGADRGLPVMKGVWPGIRPHDRVLLWAGSLLDWQDPLTLIDAVGELARTRDDVKLVFMGTRHPNPLVSPMRIVEESRSHAAQRGLLDSHVFFNAWVPYDQRALFLREADLGLSTHRDHLETHFSFRTRMLDYIWAGLPIVCTRGDFFATLVDQRGLGIAVPPGDASTLGAAIAAMLDDTDRRRAAKASLDAVRGEMPWGKVVAPLARYCAQPWLAADHAPGAQAFRERLEAQYRGSKRLKQAILRLGLSEYQIERVKQSGLGRAAMAVQNRRALRRAARQRG